MRRRNNIAGFTIVELLIATAVFSTVLVIVTAGVVRFTKQYYKGQVVNNTQNVTRAAVNQIAQSIQFGGGTAAPIGTSHNGIGGYCVNNHPYFYALGRQVNGTDTGLADSTAAHGLVSSNSTCSNNIVDVTQPLPASLTNPQELLGKNMRLARFSISDNNGLVTVSMRVVYGDHDLLCYKSLSGACVAATTTADLQQPTLQCASGSGSEYCAVADYSVTTTKRLQ